VEQHRRGRIGRDLLALAAVEIGVKREAARIMLFHQHHPHGRTSLGGGRRQRDRVGIVGFARFRFGEPGVEQEVRIVGHRRSM
jgi:hypothetical protein